MIKIFPLSEGVFTIGFEKKFKPFNIEKDRLEDRSAGSIIVEVQPFLIITSKDIIVLDTGLGYMNEEQPQIHENIIAHGYQPDQVTKVLLSHLHQDHAGGLMYADYVGNLKTCFPNATYYVYAPEIDYALKTGLPTYIPNEILPFIQTNQLIKLTETEGQIDGYIKYWKTGAHSPEHIAFLIEEGDDKIFYGGDEAPQYNQMIVKYIAKYDFDGKKAMELRSQFAIEGKKENWTFLFYHDISTPFTKL